MVRVKQVLDKRMRCVACHEKPATHDLDLFTQCCERCLPVVVKKSNLVFSEVKPAFSLPFLDFYLLNSQSDDDRITIDFTVISIITFCLSVGIFVLIKSNGQEVSAICCMYILTALFFAMFVYMKYEECYGTSERCIKISSS